MKVLIHTAVIGDVPRFKLNETQFDFESPNVDYVCFTDQDITSDIWKIHKVVNTNVIGVGECRRFSRNFKFGGYKYYEDYDYYVWIDSTISIHKDICNYITDQLIGVDICFAKHPQRSTVLQEIWAVKANFKEDDSIYNNLKKKLRNDGYPQDHGLVAANRFFYKNEEQPKIFLERWHNEYNNSSYRDQLTCNYSLWKTNTTVRYIESTTLRANGIGDPKHKYM